MSYCRQLDTTTTTYYYYYYCYYWPGIQFVNEVVFCLEKTQRKLQMKG